MSLTTETYGGAAVLTLCWTEKRNALSADDADQVAAAITEAGVLTGARALVITGEGAFSAGGDLRYFATLGSTLSADEVRDTVYGRVQAMIRALRDCPVPTIAAVDGPAVGLGMDLALACDMRFVGPDGHLAQGWAKAGLIPGTGGVALLDRVAPGALWPLLATGERIGSDRAVELGIAEAGLPDAYSAAIERVEALSRIDAPALAGYAALSRLAAWPDEENFDRAGRLQGRLLTSESFRERAESILGRS